MTYASFETNQSNTKTTAVEKAIVTRTAVSFIRTLFRVLLTKHPIDADTILAGQARHEAARRSADNLLR